MRRIAAHTRNSKILDACLITIKRGEIMELSSNQTDVKIPDVHKTTKKKKKPGRPHIGYYYKQDICGLWVFGTYGESEQRLTANAITDPGFIAAVKSFIDNANENISKK